MNEVVEKKKSINVLMVEDNQLDTFLTTEILSETKRVYYQVSTVIDGVEALSFLRKKNGYKDAQRPDLIILDLNLPRMNGFDFLSRIKTDPEFKSIPVCILTTSEAKEDMEKAKELKVDCYLVKPLDLEKFETAFAALSD